MPPKSGKTTTRRYRLKTLAPLELEEQLRQLVKIGSSLTQERDLHKLLDHILFESRRFTRAEAGTLYVREKDAIRFTCVQNDALPQDSTEAGKASGDLMPITRKSLAGYAAATGEILNIPDVYALPEGVEYGFNDSYDRRSGFRTGSMLVVPLKKPLGEVIGVLQLINAQDASGRRTPFPKEIEELVLSLASQAAIAIENTRLLGELKRAYEEIVFRLARAAEFRDTDTGAHIHRMSRYCVLIGEALGLSEQERADLLLAAPMHDVGKIAIADAILQKPGRLTAEEYAEMKRHTTIGGEILGGSDIPLLQYSQTIALTHHEKWDGTGYPRGLRGDAIPLVGRIAAVADVFDALASKRVYKEPLPVERALETIRNGAGKEFDPAVADAFGRVFDRVLDVRGRYP